MKLALAALSLVALLVVSGCSSPAATDTRTLPPEPGPLPVFANFTTPASAPDGFGSEPSLLVGSDGALYFTTVLGSATARGDGLFRSSDNGTTWQYLGKADYPFGGGDSDIDQLADGTLLLTGQWRPTAIPALPGVGSPYVTGGESVSRSTDGGATWTPFPTAGYLADADRNWLATSGDKTAYLVYNQGVTGLMVGKTTDGGGTWMPPVMVTGSTDSPGGGPNGIAGDAVTDKDGNLYIPYGPGPGGGTVQRVLSSMDGGQTFTSHVVHTTPANATSGAIFSTLAVDTGGELYLAWAETDGKAMRIYVSHSEDKAETWGPPIVVSPPGLSAAFPWIVAGAPDHIAVAYYGADGEFRPDDAPKDKAWVPMVSFMPDIHAGQFTFTSVTTQPNHHGPICTGGTGCSSGRNLGDFFEAALDKWGHVVVVWADDEGQAQSNHVAVQQNGPSQV